MSEPRDLRGPILLGALVLAALDALIVLLLAGGIGQLVRGRAAARAAAFAVVTVLTGPWRCHRLRGRKQVTNRHSSPRSKRGLRT